MSIYQRYLFKSLMFFSILLFLLAFILESNCGFKLFFNVTNYLFLGLKTEEISGNWRDFTLKNITYNFHEVSIKATHVHILIDPISLFKINKIFKKIETKNLVFLFNKNSSLFLRKKNIQKNMFLNYHIILKKIYSDKIFLKLHDKNILLFNVNSGLKFTKNNLIIFPTHVHSMILYFKKNNQQCVLNKLNLINKQKINDFLSFFINKKFLFPVNINLISIKCKKVKFFHQVFKNIFFQANLNNQFIFKLKTNDLYKFNFFGKVLLNVSNHPIYFHLYIHRIIFHIDKNLVFSSKNFNGILKGTIDNYNLSFKNIINISGMPSVILNIFGNGKFTNMYFNKICCIPFLKKNKDNKLISLKKENYIKYLSKIAGNIHISTNFSKEVNSIHIPNFNVKANIINKKLLILGSLFYNQSNSIKIPKISFFAGKNKGCLSGHISKLVNINSSFNMNNLDYFIPNITGAVTTTLNIYGACSSPSISSLVFGERLNWKNIVYLNKIKIFFNINSQKNSRKDIYLIAKKIQFSKFYLDFLKINLVWNNIQQKFSLFLKNKNFTLNFILNGKFNARTNIWKGTFNKINIFTFNTKWITNNHPVIFFYVNKENQKNNLKEVQSKNSIVFTIQKIKKFLFSSIFNSSINFKTNFIFKTKFISDTKKKFSNLYIFLYGNNIKFQKKIKNKVFSKTISSLRLSVFLKKNNIITRLLIYPLKNKNNKIFGFLNIYDFLHQQNIKGKYFLFNFPCSILTFFLPNEARMQGICMGNIEFLGTVYQPNILANIHVKNFYIKSNKILRYITLYFYPSLELIKYIKINQSIFIKKGKILFKLDSVSTNNLIKSVKWNISFNSNEVIFFIFPKITINLFLQLNLHYFLLQYNLIGYLKSCLFNFKINEKNFIF
ncbi:hypothetical protein RJT32_00440 [Buchnera aphidicola (Aphis aurantii)]|uniref:hypothetical protein n=1 Tax=Buchnera aphidicola TaxID=9 RepID=UPI0031B730E6